MNLGLIGVLLLGSAAVTGALAAYRPVSDRFQVTRTLRAMRGASLASLTTPNGQELSLPFGERVLAPSIRRLGTLAVRFTPLSTIQKLRKLLDYVGSPEGWDAERVLAWKAIAACGGVALGLLMAGAGNAPPGRRLLLVALLGVLGYLAPDWALRSRAKSRQNAIWKALPDTVDVLAITVEAGIGFEAALLHVAGEAPGPLSGELQRAIREIQLGKPRSEALRDLADRSSVPELKSFVLAMIQAEIFGVPIVRVLQVQAQEMRIKRRQRAEEQAQKIPVKIVIPLVFCVLPALFVVLIGPAAINIQRALFKG